MRKYLFIFVVSFTVLTSTAQEKDSIIQQKPTNLVGLKTRANFNQQPYILWFDKNYKSYVLDKTILKKLKKQLKGVKIKAFMGTWCGDSKRETPRFYKLLDSVNYNTDNLTLITLNRSKKTPDNLQEGYGITRVPTFIFYKNDKEIGRYVEYPRETLEKDILKILSGEPYKHAYEE